jgi:MioC protein
MLLSDSIAILVGTMTGTAEIVAEEVMAVLEEEGLSVEILPMDHLSPDVFDDKARAYVICTSTYGQGDVPDNARDLFEAVKEGRPDLSGLRYGVIGLGDSTYADTFNQGGRLFDELLAELGAKRVGERTEHNASSDVLPEDQGVEWAREWAGLIREGATAAA